jgi:spore germination cell wall hydrolase CwlJ-like protein
MTRDDLWTFAKTIWAEARGEPLEGQIAVANVILNRARQGGWWGDDVVKVCRKPKQFSCWNKGDPNRAKMNNLELQDRAFARAVSVAAGACAGDMADTTGGATHYHTAAIEPSWAAGHEPSARIGNHVFYNSVR